MIVRQATEADELRLVEMMTRFLLSTPYGRWVQPTPEQSLEFVQLILKIGGVFVVERDSGRRVPGVCVDIDGNEWHAPGGCDVCKPVLVGMLAGIIAPHPMHGEMHADEVAWWVEPEHRGGRAAYRMLRSFEEWARQNGAIVVKMVAPTGSAVGGFYQRLGYSPVECMFAKRL